MYSVQSNCNTIVSYFRPNRKCFPFNGSLSFLLILFIAQQAAAAIRTSQDEDLSRHFDVGAALKDADNLETHHAQEDHPVIIYKEDFVSEDYVPFKNAKKSEKHKRRYKDIANRRRNNRENLTDVVIEENSDKMLFDILPEKPLIVPEDMERYKKSHMKLVPLLDELSEANETDREESSFKAELQKAPKKFHRRVRRSVTRGEHIVLKRNPFFRQAAKVSGEIVPTQVQQFIYMKHSVPGKKHNGLDIPVPGPRQNPTTGPSNNKEPVNFNPRIAADENDRVIFSGGRRTTPRPAQRSTESIFRDPRPENFDFSFMGRTTTAAPLFTRRPEVSRQDESVFRDPRPQNFDFSFMNPQQQQSSFAPARVPAPASTTESASEINVSQCVWAIVNCCSARSSEIRYACFEQNGCYGAFWDLNPCADNVRDSFVNFLANYYN